MSKETRTTSSTGGAKGTKLERFDLIPTGPLAELAEHFGIGASKYADHQWRRGYEWSKSYAALVRHLNAFWAGKDYDTCSNDPDGCSRVDVDGEPFTAVREDACFNHTGSHHMAAVAWHAFALLEFKDRFPNFDDRFVAEGEDEEDEDVKSLHFPPLGFDPAVEVWKQVMDSRAMLDEVVSEFSRFVAGPHGIEDRDDSMSVTHSAVEPFAESVGLLPKRRPRFVDEAHNQGLRRDG